MKNVINTLIVGFMVFIGYTFVGHDYVKFNFLDGKAETLDVAKRINKLCNASGSCPKAFEGWQQDSIGGEPMLTKGSMIYFLLSDPKSEKSEDKNKSYPSFRLVYRFFMPDDWFEARGGVGMKVTAGWKSR